jgi:hypothetical protein
VQIPQTSHHFVGVSDIVVKNLIAQGLKGSQVPFL